MKRPRKTIIISRYDGLVQVGTYEQASGVWFLRRWWYEDSSVTHRVTRNNTKWRYLSAEEMDRKPEYTSSGDVRPPPPAAGTSADARRGARWHDRSR